MELLNTHAVAVSATLCAVAFIFAFGRRGYDAFLSIFILLGAQHLFFYSILANAIPVSTALTVTAISLSIVVLWMLAISRK